MVLRPRQGGRAVARVGTVTLYEPWPEFPVLLRAPLLPFDAARSLMASEDARVLCRAMLSEGHVRAAVATVSPSLAHAVAAWLDDRRDLSERALAALCGYIVRGSWVPVPLGSLATSSIVAVEGNGARLQLNGVDTIHLSDTSRQAEARGADGVTAHPTLRHVGNRYWVQVRVGTGRLMSNSIRALPEIARILHDPDETARDPKLAALGVILRQGGFLVDADLPTNRGKRPLADALRGVSGTLPRTVAEDAACLAGVLAAAAPVQRLRVYRERFLRRYEATDRGIPAVELADEHFGIGAPTSIESEQSELALQLRDRVRLATSPDTRVVHLSSDDFCNAVGDDREGSFAPDIALGIRLAAQSSDDLERGTYLIHAAASPRFPSAYAALPRVAQFDDLTVPLARPGADEIVAQLVAPIRGRSSTVAPHLTVAEHTICFDRVLAPVNGTRSIAPDDVLVVLTASGFELRHRPTGKRLRIVENHAVNPLYHDGAARLLAMVECEGRHTTFGLTELLLEQATYLPEVRWGRCVLSPRAWRVPRTALLEPIRDLRDRFVHLRVDRYLYVMIDGHPTVVDTMSERSLELLQAAITRTDTRYVVLTHALDAEHHGWLRDAAGNAYLAELVVPLVHRTPARRSQASPRSLHVHSATERVRPPGSEWVYTKLWCGLDIQDLLLTHYIGSLIDELKAAGMLAGWFFVRYAEDLPHLRLRIEAAGEREAALLQHVAGWATKLMREGLITRFCFDCYEREFERYGGAQTYPAVERAFEIGSQSALEALRMVRSQGYGARVRAAVSETVRLLASGELLGDAQVRLAWETPLGADKYALVRELLRNDAADWSAPTYRPLCEALGAERYRGLLGDLAHMQCNRLGVRPEDEQPVRAMTVRLARSFLIRTAGDRSVR
jgi:hypothetical protein